MSVLGLIKLAMGGFLAVAVIIAGARGGGSGQNPWLLFALALVLIGAGVYDVVKVANRRAQVRLTAEGFSLLTLGAVLVPWSMVDRVEYILPATSSAVIRFHLRPEADLPINFNPLALGGAFQLTAAGARFVQIDTSALQDAARLIFGALAQIAPQVPVQNWR